MHPPEYCHRTKRVFVVLHVFGFLCVGPWVALEEWDAGSKKVPDLKHAVVRGGQEAKHLIRVIRTEGEISCEVET